MEDPKKWRKWTDDRNCVAIVAAWGDQWQTKKGWENVRDRRIEVAKWLNKYHRGKVGVLKALIEGTLETSSARIPYHPGYFLRRKAQKPVFVYEEIPEK